ncbi:helix-turn-helix domain-containing protein [Streptomyces longwoodensis]|uniref:helix-turn-helix domain-containing protein n=1 Tax=Streptomyces longwoodensis TaxID=68231 RepID=UPI00384CF4F3
MPDARTPAPRCTPPCDLPSVPQLAVGALLRHHRGRKGLTIKAAGQLAGIPASHVSQTELMQRPVTESLTRSLLTVYDVPAEEVQQAADLAAQAEEVHLHEADAESLRSGAWVAALKGASRETVILTTGPLQPAFYAAAAVSLARGRQQAHWRATLLLHEPVLNRTPAQHLAQLLRLIDTKTLGVRLIPGSLAVEPGVVTQWALTAWSWDGSAAQRDRRLLHFAHAPQQPSLVRNGHAAFKERQVIEAATQRALSPEASAHRIRQAVQGVRRWALHSPQRDPARASRADAGPRRSA